MKTYQNKDICTKCGGGCCKQLPGGVSPADLTEVTKESLLKLLQTGKYAIDWWEGDYPEYFIRPAIKNCSSIFDPTWGGECVFLTDIDILLIGSILCVLYNNTSLIKTFTFKD